MAASMDTEVTSPKELVLWMWRSHNKVNKRLHGDASEDPKYPKVPFPPKSACSACHRSQDGGVPQFDEEAVLAYLLELYGSDHIIRAVSEEEDNPDSNSDRNDLNIPDSSSDRKDMDWWQKMQRNKDLEKLRELRQMKLEGKRKKQRDKLLNHRDVSTREVNLPAIGPVSKTDLGLCAVYYVLCVSIIVALYYHFFYKKRCKSKKHFT
jgi:thiol oxidase